MQDRQRHLLATVLSVLCLCAVHVGACTGKDRNMAKQRTVPPPGRWLSWSTWSACSTRCGVGQRIRTRRCTALHCVGSSTDRKACTGNQCPSDGVVGPWAGWSPCSKTCGGGEQQRVRVCIRKEKNGGRPCPALTQKRVCQERRCPRPGRFTPWTTWSSCSKSCGRGESQRSRVCAPPDEGGKPCSGLHMERRECLIEDCPPPVHGSWAPWTSWLSCSATCATGKQMRYRTCSRPAPRNGGRQCEGSTTVWRSCHGAPCAVNGGWSKWRTCDGYFCKTRVEYACALGTVRKCRDCNNPTPQNGGKYCIGPPMLDADCWSTTSCPDEIAKPMNFSVVGIPNSNNVMVKWQRAPYGKKIVNFAAFALRDGTGVDEIIRRIVPLRPNSLDEVIQNYHVNFTGLLNGQMYKFWVQAIGEMGSFSSSQPLLFKIGRVDGSWSSWGHFSYCSVTCGRGKMFATRRCDNPPPSNGGLYCPGKTIKYEACRGRQRYCSYYD